MCVYLKVSSVVNLELQAYFPLLLANNYCLSWKCKWEPPVPGRVKAWWLLLLFEHPENRVATGLARKSSWPLCSCACVFVHVCAGVHACEYICIWRPEDNPGCRSSGIAHYFWDKASLWPEAHQVGYADWPGNSRGVTWFHLPSAGTTGIPSCPDFKSTHFNLIILKYNLSTLYLYATYYSIHPSLLQLLPDPPHSPLIFMFSFPLKKKPSTEYNCLSLTHLVWDSSLEHGLYHGPFAWRKLTLPSPAATGCLSKGSL